MNENNQNIERKFTDKNFQKYFDEAVECLFPSNANNVTEQSFAGIFRVQNQEKKRVFYGEAREDAWMEMNLFRDGLELAEISPSSELLNDYRSCRNQENGRKKFTWNVVASGLMYRDARLRQEVREKFQKEFLNTHPGYKLYADDLIPFSLRYKTSSDTEEAAEGNEDQN